MEWKLKHGRNQLDFYLVVFSTFIKSNSKIATMENQSKKSENKSTIQTVVDIAIKLGVLFLLLAWCFKIVYPFVSIVLWALIISVAVLIFGALNHNDALKRAILQTK